MTDSESTFTVNIHLGNAEMQTPDDVAYVLRKIADKLERDGGSGFYETIFDNNGNDVGRYRFKSYIVA